MTIAITTPEELREATRGDFTFSAQQFAAIAAPLAPGVVVAGAGSGKTTVMAARVAYLVLTGQVRPDQVLGLTFTTKATAELAARVRSMLRAAGVLPDGALATRERDADPGDDELLEPTVSTYNAYASALLTDHGLRIGHEPDARVMADASRYQLAARAIARYPHPVRLLSDHPETVIAHLLALDAAMSEHQVDPEQVRDFDRQHLDRLAAALLTERARTDLEKAVSASERRLELLGLVTAYRRLKADLGLIDFSDQIERAARLAAAHPEVGAEQRERFRVVLLDEYQDTSVAQARMLSRLFSGPTAAAGRGHPVTAVGDPNQAIYGWRGASVSNILRFGEDFPAADGRTDVPALALTVNRRSERRILDVANRLAQPLLDRYPQVRALEAKPEAGEGVVRVAVHDTDAEELAWLPGQVQAAYAALPHRPDRPRRWSDLGVLVRDNATAADVFDHLSRAEIPVEIVGLQGLLRLPEVAEVVATLELLHDVTANAALLTVLAGPRWAIGPRDLALLGRRAEELSLRRRPPAEDHSLTSALDEAVAGADPTEVVALCDALDDPGEAAYDPQARERFGLLAGELRMLRSHAGEPLLDLVRRIVDVTGIDVELASSTSPSAAARRENLDLFLKAVADFQAIDGDVTLPALLAYLQTEDDMGTGLDVATPSEADSVKLLTVHRAKGLEWHTVFCVGVAQDRFPTTRSRPLWTSSPAVLPTPLRGDARDLPALGELTRAGLLQLRTDTRAHEAEEELRLGYVAFTRAAHELVVSSFCWTDSRQKPLGPSPYQRLVKETLEEWGEPLDRWREAPEPDEPNPLLGEVPTVPWPVPDHTPEVARRLEAAALVRAAIARRAGGVEGGEADRESDRELDLDLVEQQAVMAWDDELDRLVAEAERDRAPTLEVELPRALSATTMARLREDPDGLAADLVRPMPRRPSAAARFGTRFHAWVESRFGQQQLLDPEDLPGRAETDIVDGDDLAAVIAAFEAGPFADRVPVAVEQPFSLVLAGRVVRGRIDAVYAEGDGYLVVDWKTGQREAADPLQLALYRLAWAETAGVPLERVGAAFCFVRSGRLVTPSAEELPDRAALEAWLASPWVASPT